MVIASLKSLEITWKSLIALALIATLSAGSFILFSKLVYRIGFPLDDAWIHQTYARNIAMYGEWSFVRGQVSGGSTSPLWSALLAPGFLIGLSPYFWAFFLGIISLWSLSLVIEIAARKLSESYRSRVPWVGILILLEWHLIWSSVSGMETILFTLIITSVLVMIAVGSRRYVLMGLLIGISVWLRPDGITLLGPIIFVVIIEKNSWRYRLNPILRIIMGFGILFALYMLFNLLIAGTPLPNTFYAKQAEYADLQQIPFYRRYFDISLQVFTGIGIILLPGVVFLFGSAIKKRSWGIVAVTFWCLSYVGLYAWRLPVSYQHGRYIIPAMPIFFLLGITTIINLQTGGRWRKLIGIAWKFSLGLIAVCFLFLGAQAYAKDVAFVESEMVEMAQWVSQNTPGNSLVAAHDIGALGYFSRRPLIDLAGLITPEVVPFIRNEEQLAGYLDRRQVDYLVTFPDWYPHITDDLVPVFVTNGRFAPEMGGTNMAVYRWKER
jgi:hypothetical protein